MRQTKYGNFTLKMTLAEAEVDAKIITREKKEKNNKREKKTKKKNTLTVHLV